MRRFLALLVLGALVVGVIYVWKYQPGRLPSLRKPELGNVGDKLGGVGDKLGRVGETVSEKFRASKIKGAVKAALELNRNLNPYPIDVDAQDDGTVVLKGDVPSEDLRAAAARVAASVPDVARVDNQVRVAGTAPASPAEGRSLGENFDDHALEAKVKLAYSLNKDMKGADVSVSAFRREVTLAGTVGSEAQRQLAVQIAQQTPQVATVKDQLQVGGNAGASVAPPAAASPAAAGAGTSTGDRAQRAQAALVGNANLAVYVLKVQEQGGRLVLSGRVRTGAEKDLAGVVARDAAGAAVLNNVIVQP